MALQKHVRIDYPELLRTLGHLIQREHLSEVTITEFDGGWIVTGLTFKTTGQGFIRVPADFVLSHADVQALAAELLAQRPRAKPAKRGWLQ